MFTQVAYAQNSEVTKSQEMLVSLIPFVFIFLIMYFLIIRPQRVQMKKRNQMLLAIRRGDTVVTGGGLIAKVTRVLDNEELELDLGSGLKVFAVRSTISDVRVKGEPVTQSKS